MYDPSSCIYNSKKYWQNACITLQLVFKILLVRKKTEKKSKIFLQFKIGLHLPIINTNHETTHKPWNYTYIYISEYLKHYYKILIGKGKIITQNGLMTKLFWFITEATELVGTRSYNMIV